MVDMLITLTLAIISKTYIYTHVYRCVYWVVHLKYLSFLIVSYISVKVEKFNIFNSYRNILVTSYQVNCSTSWFLKNCSISSKAMVIHTEPFVVVLIIPLLSGVHNDILFFLVLVKLYLSFSLSLSLEVYQFSWSFQRTSF